MRKEQRRPATAPSNPRIVGERTWQRKLRRGSRVVPVTNPQNVAGRKRKGVFVAAVLLALLATGFATAMAGVLHDRSSAHAISRSRLVSSRGRARYLVLIVLDGARPDYFGMTRLPNVDTLRAEGVQYTKAMDGILESETPSGHTTISTGSTPARDGILGFDWAQSDNDYSLFSPDVVRAGAMEHIMASANVPTIAGLYKARYPSAKVVALSGHKYYAADPLGGPSADAIMYYQGSAQGTYIPVAIPGHVPPSGVLNAPGVTGPTIHGPLGNEDALATRLAIAAFKKMHQRITLINYPEFDWPLGHVDGSDRGKTIRLMRSFDHDLGTIEAAYRRAGVLAQTLFVITADHGMSPLKRFVPDTVFTNAVAQAGTKAPAVSYSTATYLWLSDTTRAHAVARNLLGANDPGIQSVYYLSVRGLPHYVHAGGSFVSSEVDSANKYLLGTLMNGHEPTIVAFCREGQSSINPSTDWKADHGGANWQSQHIPLILEGPGIPQGQIQVQPAQLDDVAPTILTAMGVRPTGMEGHALTEALTQTTAADRRARDAETAHVTPLVNALMAQDVYESSH
ncbi:MAG: alkaline phosphatase family protein [Chloroflexota bacterium]